MSDELLKPVLIYDKDFSVSKDHAIYIYSSFNAICNLLIIKRGGLYGKAIRLCRKDSED